MREQFGDLWQMPADAICITTNGFIKANGKGVMGAGTAGQAQMRYPYLPSILGDLLKTSGNHVNVMSYEDLQKPGIPLIMFPVKHAWYENADIELIKQSALELKELADKHEDWLDILLPRPGCGNGGLDWEEVRPVLESILDDRFIIVDR